MNCPICKGSGFETVHYDDCSRVIACRACNGAGSLAPRVLNRRVHGIPKDAVYIGRGGKWGNQFLIGPDGDRTEVIRKYEEWFMEDIERVKAAKLELKDRNLVCYCSPDKCHGDFLLRIANED